MPTAIDPDLIVVRPPRKPSTQSPLVVVWHLGDPPRSAAAMAAALPLDAVDAWVAYPTLPLSGKRLPDGGLEALGALGMADPVLKLYEPIQSGAAAEFEALVPALRARYSITDPRLVVVGGSMGGAVALTVLTESALPITAASLIVPETQLRVLVDGIAPMFNMTYEWKPEALAVAKRFDFVARAKELAARRPALKLQCLLGADDSPFINQPATALRGALLEAGLKPAQLEWTTLADHKHGFAEEPGLDAAPQTDAAKRIDAEVSRFLAAALR